MQFSLGRLMIAVALVGVGCWAIVLRQSLISVLAILLIGPLIGACWARLIALKPFDRSRRPELVDPATNPRAPSEDRIIQSIVGGILGGAVGAVIITGVAAFSLPFVPGPSGSRDLFVVALASVVWFVFSALAGYLVGLLVGLSAEAVSRWATRWQR